MKQDTKQNDPNALGFDLLGTGLIYASSQNENAKTYTTDIAIANATGFTKNYVDRKIRTHYERLSKLGKKGIEFSLIKINKRGRQMKVYKLNRKQAIFLCNTFDDSEFILDFKSNLADAFIDALDMLNNRKLTHELHKPRVIELGQTIKDNLHPEPNSHIYQHFNNLPYLLLFGMNAKKLREVRGYPAKEDILSCISIEESRAVNKVRHAITTLVSLKFDYHEVKDALSVKVIKLPVMAKGDELQ